MTDFVKRAELQSMGMRLCDQGVIEPSKIGLIFDFLIDNDMIGEAHTVASQLSHDLIVPEAVIQLGSSTFQVDSFGG
jgi:hypothetical protein